MVMVRPSEQNETIHSTYGRYESDWMTTSQLQIGLSILGEVAEEKIEGPCGCMTELCKSG